MRQLLRAAFYSRYNYSSQEYIEKYYRLCSIQFKLEEQINPLKEELAKLDQVEGWLCSHYWVVEKKLQRLRRRLGRVNQLMFKLSRSFWGIVDYTIDPCYR